MSLLLSANLRACPKAALSSHRLSPSWGHSSHFSLPGSRVRGNGAVFHNKLNAVPRASHDNEMLCGNEAAELRREKKTCAKPMLPKVLLASFVGWLVWLNLHASVALAASPESIRASSLGLQIAGFFKKSGFPDELVVFALATLPVLELRGAIPVGYWLQLDPVKVYLLSVIGNMVPVPLILLYLDKLSTMAADRSSMARKLLDALYRSTRRKAGPIQEFKWLGLMLFVAVPFPGTGAWTGAIAAVVLGMPFWSSFWANLLGVLLAGLLVNLMVNIGLQSACLVGLALFAFSTFIWSFLRSLKQGPAGS